MQGLDLGEQAVAMGPARAGQDGRGRGAAVEVAVQRLQVGAESPQVVQLLMKNHGFHPGSASVPPFRRSVVPSYRTTPPSSSHFISSAITRWAMLYIAMSSLLKMPLNRCCGAEMHGRIRRPTRPPQQRSLSLQAIYWP